jgi:hypothetical protein
VLQPGAPSAAEDAGLADGVTADRYARLEFMAGAAMLGFGMIYLVILCEFALGACFAGTAFTRAMVMRLLIPGAVFTFAVVLGLVLTRSKTQQQRSGGGHP